MKKNLFAILLALLVLFTTTRGICRGQQTNLRGVCQRGSQRQTNDRLGLATGRLTTVFELPDPIPKQDRRRYFYLEPLSLGSINNCNFNPIIIIRTLNRRFEWLLEVASIILLIRLALVVVLAVIFRFSGSSLVWYDEVASVQLAWLTYYGAALFIAAEIFSIPDAWHKALVGTDYEKQALEEAIEEARQSS